MTTENIISNQPNGRPESSENYYWIVSETVPTTTVTTTSARQQPSRPIQGALFTSKVEMDAYIASTSSSTTIFPNGYSVRKISRNANDDRSLKDLKDALVHIFSMPSSTSTGSTTVTTTTLESLPSSSPTPTTFDKDKKTINKNWIQLEELQRFQLFREVIDHEDDLLNQRVSWIILAQSFLMAAFITTSSNGENSGLRYITSVVGLATVLVTLPAIVAAGLNIEIQQQVYFKGIESDERCRELHGHDKDGTFRGRGAESQLRRSMGHLFPSTAYRGRFGVPILVTISSLVAVQLIGWICLLLALRNEW